MCEQHLERFVEDWFFLRPWKAGIKSAKSYWWGIKTANHGKGDIRTGALGNRNRTWEREKIEETKE